MNINDVDFGHDIFDELPQKLDKAKLEDWIFPIIGRSHEKSEGFSNGTGYFINCDGYFVTAGHVMEDNEKTYKAIIRDKEYDVELLFIEYVDLEDQKPPFCKDLAIGKIDFRIERELTYFFGNDSLDGNELNFSGYKQEPPRVILDRKPVYFFSFKANDEKLEEVKRKENENGTDIISDKRPVCKNTRSLKLKEGTLYRGMSGGPVYKDNCIYGLFIGNEYILAKYITEKLNQLGISFKSTQKDD